MNILLDVFLLYISIISIWMTIYVIIATVHIHRKHTSSIKEKSFIKEKYLRFNKENKALNYNLSVKEFPEDIKLALLKAIKNSETNSQRMDYELKILDSIIDDVANLNVELKMEGKSHKISLSTEERKMLKKYKKGYEKL